MEQEQTTLGTFTSVFHFSRTSRDFQKTREPTHPRNTTRLAGFFLKLIWILLFRKMITIADFRPCWSSWNTQTPSRWKWSRNSCQQRRIWMRVNAALMETWRVEEGTRARDSCPSVTPDGSVAPRPGWPSAMTKTFATQTTSRATAAGEKINHLLSLKQSILKRSDHTPLFTWFIFQWL